MNELNLTEKDKEDLKNIPNKLWRLEHLYKIRTKPDRNHQTKIIPYKPGIYLKDAGALAGIGSIGKNNLLITKEFGAQIRLRALVSAAPLIVGTPIYNKIYCNNCDVCIESCPAQALTDGKYNKEACHSYCLSNLENLSKDTVLWCNVCIESCPIGDIKEEK